jgi:hypothetical protein
MLSKQPLVVKIADLSSLQIEALQEQTAKRIEVTQLEVHTRPGKFNALSGDVFQFVVNHADLALFAAWLSKERLFKVKVPVTGPDGKRQDVVIEYQEKAGKGSSNLLQWLSGMIDRGTDGQADSGDTSSGNGAN